ncbi:4-hydroxybenzoate octaprenyltransferase [Gorillibacterium timonense]|uniref:4-hydroxybenzoate octaprenyltransferase n=1 Tax=Gorillibacterium timonense TaxID=1689269 RepID=UPI00071C35AA|nr:4-hydroxybenzoate octaprenyltransferase [Gorillibacterium timonense]
MSLLRGFYGKLHDYGVLVMFQHTIFSFSFAIVSLLLAAGGFPSWRLLAIIVVALLAARTGANALNRVIDAEFDKRNPRTANRQIPRGDMSKREALLLSVVCFVITLFAAFLLNPLCAVLAPPAIFFMVIYSYTKRFTPLCHLVLGFTCSIAPVGAWLAVTGHFSWTPIFLAGANMFWVAGFDIIYGAQDAQFDHANGLYSMLTEFGVPFGLVISTLFHAVAMFCLLVVGLLQPEFGWIYYFGAGIVLILLIIEHRVVSPGHLQHATFASYNINELVSIVFLACGVLDVFL